MLRDWRRTLPPTPWVRRDPQKEGDSFSSGGLSFSSSPQACSSSPRLLYHFSRRAGTQEWYEDQHPARDRLYGVTAQCCICLSQSTVPLVSLPLRSLCLPEACWSRNSEWMTCSRRTDSLMASWFTPRTR